MLIWAIYLFEISHFRYAYVVNPMQTDNRSLLHGEYFDFQTNKMFHLLIMGYLCYTDIGAKKKKLGHRVRFSMPAVFSSILPTVCTSQA